MKKSKKIVKKRSLLMLQHGRFCYICGKILQPNNPRKHNGFTLDHVTPKSKYGIELMPCCWECNERKKNMDLIRLEKGTIVKIEGIPFQLATDTDVYGDKASYEEALKERAATADSPNTTG